MRYLITGGAGFVGSHLAERLVSEGHQVSVLDNLSTGRRENVERLIGHPNFELTVGDVLDDSVVADLIGRCDQVLHLAAAVGVKRIMEEPVETLMTNVRGTEIVLHCALRASTKVLITSTSEVYGKAMEVNGGARKLSEKDDWTLGPTSKRRWAYACSKALDEFLALAFYEEKKLPVVIARLFNTVGPRQTGRYGMVVPNFVQRALNDEPILVHGNGEQSRSFTHVNDAVDALIGLMDSEDAVGQVFNVGNGAEVTINELARRVCELTGSRSEIRHIPYEMVYGPGFEDMLRRSPDISKIKSVIAYTPTFELDAILVDVINHLESCPEAVSVDASYREVEAAC